MRFSPRIAGRRPLVVAAAALAVVGGAGTALAVGPLGDGDRSAELAAAIDSSKPRNVILLIGDGTDDSILTAARNYEYGAAGRLPALDALPFTGDMTTYGLKVGPGPDYPIAYVSDSAPTASGWSTGKKTVDSRLSQGPSTAGNVPGEDYETALEILKAQGKRVGNVSTAALTDATPAAAASHINLRECQGPANMANCSSARKVNGGKGSVAEQLVDNRIDVLLGGGTARFAQATDAGPSVRQYAESAHDYTTVSDASGLAGVDTLANGPILGLFANENMTPKYAPLVATAEGAGGNDARCETADRGTQPSLAQMTSKAIELLDNPKGFFLQVESAMVDKQEHASDACGAIGDVAQLDEATQAALDYQADHPDTLIIVTGDHGHSTQIVPNSASSGRFTTTLKTADGDPMTLAYSTATSTGGSMAHTGTQIRVAAKGPQAANVTGLIDQTDIFQSLLGREPSELPKNTETVTTTVTTPATTVTAPAQPVTTPAAPAAPVAPRAAVTAASSIRRRALKASGLPVAVAASGARTVTVELRRGSKRLVRKTVKANGGTATLKASTTPGALRVVVTARGAGGERTASRTVRVR